MTNARFKPQISTICTTALLVALTTSAAIAGESRDALDVMTPDGTVLRQAEHPVTARRSIALPEAGLEIHLWDEVAPSGPSHFYAVTESAGALRGRARESSHKVELADFRFDPLTEGAPAVASGLEARPENRLFLVQLVATALPELQDRIRAAGGEIHRYYTQHTLLVEAGPAERAVIDALPFVRWVGAYHPAFRLERVLRDSLSGDGPELEPQRYSLMATERGPEAQKVLGDAVRELGGSVEVLTPEGFRLEATLTQAQLAELVHHDGLHYADRWGGPAETDMDVVRDVGGADFLETMTGLTGQGVSGEILDTELRTTHQEWLNAPIIHSVGTTGSAHGTSVTSNVFAQGVSAAARGMLPDGQPIFFSADEVTQFGGAVTRHTIHEELNDPVGPYRALFQTASVGNARTLDYTTISAEMDDVLFLNQLLATQSQSNAGDQMSRPQAWAKNMVSVGGIRHLGTADRSDDNWSFGASIGPAADGRIKPDLAFFYDGIFSANNSSDTSYGSFGGTSSATPQTAGHFGLLFQMWHEGIWPGRGGAATVFDSRPKMATAKALMIHNAFRYDWNAGGANADIDRFKQGWGTADVRNLFEAAPDVRIIDEEVVLEPLGSFSTTLPIPAGEAELKATLVYVDPMGTPGAGVHRINDLTLRVTSPSGTIFWGNNGLTADNVSTSGGLSNTLDTVENVFVANPESGVWTIDVLADEVVEDSHLETPEIDADFALIVSPDLVAIFADGFESGDTSAWN